MKSNIKCRVIILIAAFVGIVEVANAFYDPGLQRWINRDPLGDISSLPLMTAAARSPIGGSDHGGEVNDQEFFAAWTDINLNLYGGIGNNPVSLIDLFGLSQCHIWDIHDENDPDPALADLNKRVNDQADEKNAKMIEDLNKVKREVAKSVAIAAAGEALGAEVAASNIAPKVATKLFAKNTGLLNNNPVLRMGWGWKGTAKSGKDVFRIAWGKKGSWLHGHLDLWTCK